MQIRINDITRLARFITFAFAYHVFGLDIVYFGYLQHYIGYCACGIIVHGDIDLIVVKRARWHHTQVGRLYRGSIS